VTVTGLQFHTESRLCLPVYAHVRHDFTPLPAAPPASREARESLGVKMDEAIDRGKKGK